MEAIESVGIVGLSFRDRGAAGLAPFTLARDVRELRVGELAALLGADELLYLATCNRVEVLYRAAGAPLHQSARGLVFRGLLGREAAPGEAERTFRLWSGRGAVAHLFEVAAGLDSAQLGEREIRGQLKDALRVARAAGTSGSLVDRLVEESLRVARQVHLSTQLGAGRLSLAEIAAELLLERVRRTSVRDASSAAPEVALIGVTPMTRRAAEILLREGVRFVFVNRTLGSAEALAAELGAGSCLSLDEFLIRPPRVEAVLSATGAPEAILDRAALERLAAHSASQEPPLVVDLSVPPDVEPETARAAQVPRIGIDEINGAAESRLESRRAEAASLREVVDRALSDLERRLAERALAPVVRRINQRYRETALEATERLLGKRGFELDEAAREALGRWAETLARRFAHLPTLGLQGLMAAEGVEAVRSFLAACDPALLEELEGAGRELAQPGDPPDEPEGGWSSDELPASQIDADSELSPARSRAQREQ